MEDFEEIKDNLGGRGIGSRKVGWKDLIPKSPRIFILSLLILGFEPHFRKPKAKNLTSWSLVLHCLSPIWFFPSTR